MICFQEQKNGAPMQVQGIGRMPICFRSDRYGDVYKRQQEICGDFKHFRNAEQMFCADLISLTADKPADGALGACLLYTSRCV